MNVTLLAASALLVQSGALLVFFQLFCNCPTHVCIAPAGHQFISTTLAAPQWKLFWLQFCLWKGWQITRTKAYQQSLYKNRQLTILSQQQFTFTERKTFFVFLEHWNNSKNSKTSRVVYSYVFLSLHANKSQIHLTRQSL
jgi:hypothetical protein